MTTFAALTEQQQARWTRDLFTEKKMGCDIHGYVEKRYKTEHDWYEVSNLDETFKSAYFLYGQGEEGYKKVEKILKELGLRDPSARNYKLFAALAGVRGEGPEPNGFPDDASEQIRAEYERWGDDAHSACHYSLQDAAKLFAENDYAPTPRTTLFPEYVYFNIHPRDAEEYDRFRVIFWFDN